MGDPEGSAGDRQELSKMRRAIAASMTLSAQVPQFTLDRSVDLTALSKVRQDLRERDVALSWEDLVVAACARGLKMHPDVNASFDEDAIVRHPHIHVGIATSVPGGLLNPAITDADTRTLPEIAEERKRLRAGAAEGRLRGVELYGATFTVSNLGAFGIDRFRALVIPPQAAILAAGRVAQLDAGAVSLNLSLSCDHRVLDGAPAAEFLADVCGLAEEPGWLKELAPAG